MTAHDVSVIVPTYNRAEYLGECLNGLLRQSRQPRQIIVVDDGSQDDTAAVVARAGAGIEYLHQANAGKSSALNHALRRALGASIWIFDDDDVADPEALALLWDALAGAPAAGFAFGRHDNFTMDPGGRRRWTTPALPEFNCDDLHWALLQRCFVFQPAMLVRRECYDTVGPFDEGLPRSQDYDMLLRLARRFPAVHVNAIVFHQRQHPGTRGPASLRIAGREVWSRQAEFDAVVIGKVYRAAALRDYLPRRTGSNPLSPSQQLRALCRRSAVTARRGLWEAASQDLSSAVAIARSSGLRSLPDEAVSLYSWAFERRDGVADLDLSNPLVRAALAVADRRLRSQVLAALFWPGFKHGMRAMAAGDLRRARHHAGSYLRLTRGLALPSHMSRLASKSLGLLRRALRGRARPPLGPPAAPGSVVRPHASASRPGADQVTSLAAGRGARTAPGAAAGSLVPSGRAAAGDEPG